MLPRLALSLLFVGLSTPAWALDPPDDVRQMIWNALDTKDPTVIASVVSIAKQTFPDSAAEIDIIAQRQTVRVIRQSMPQPDLTSPPEPKSPLSRFHLTLTRPHWRGAVEVGAAQSTGNTDSTALYGSVDLALKDGDWTHKVNARADYQQTSGAATAERFAVAYQPQLQIQEGLYAYSLGQFEHDRFQGYRRRYTLGIGAGVKAVDRPNLTVAVDAGPALRRTEYYDLGRQDAVAGRASLTLKWLPLPNVTIGNDTDIYLENGHTTARSSTTLDTLVFGPLKARLSYNVQLEQDRPAQRSDVDTTTRASLVYSF